MASLHVHRFVVGDLSENAYVVSDISSGDACIIDPGDAFDTIATYILTNNFVCRGICLTHGHFDHFGAAWELSKSFSIPVYMNEKDEFLFNNTTKHSHKEFLHIVPEIVDTSLMPIAFGTLSIIQLATPGHTPGSTTFIMGNGIFSGDTLFADGLIGEWRYRGGHKKDLAASIEKILALDQSFILYPGHGEEQLLAESARMYKELYTHILQ